MRTSIVICFILFGLISCNSSIDGESTATAEKTFAIDQFTDLEIDCHCEITLIPAETPKVVVKSHFNLTQNLVVNSKRNKLNIGENKQVGNYDLYHVIVYFHPELQTIQASNRANIKVSGSIKTNKLDIKLSDHCSLDQAFIETEKLNVTLKNKSQATIKGTAREVNLSASEESNALLTQLQSNTIYFNSKNEAKLELNPLEKLEGTAYDHSEVYYLGEPHKSITENGQAVIQKK